MEMKIRIPKYRLNELTVEYYRPSNNKEDNLVVIESIDRYSNIAKITVSGQEAVINIAETMNALKAISDRM